jgi:hypothetical protein
MTINFFRIEYESTIEMLSDYQNTMEIQLAEIQKNEKKRIKERLEEIGEDEDQYYSESMLVEEYNYHYEVMFPRSLRYSFIVLLFLNLESMLNKFCDSVKKTKNISIRSKDLKGDSVERSRTYLHKVSAIPEIESVIWDNIEDLSKVRNCIVHTLGDVNLSNDQRRLRDIAIHGVGLTIGNNFPEDGYIILSDEYCKKGLSDISALIKEVFDKAGFGPSYKI